MVVAAFRLKSHRMCTRINQCQHVTQRGKAIRDGGRELMLTAFKSPMGILCYCILSPPLLDSTISQHSMCVCLSSSLSERISHPLLLQLLAASLVIPPSAPLSLCLLSYISTSLPFFTSLLLVLPSFFFSFLFGIFLCFTSVSSSTFLHLFLITFHI